MFVFSGQTGLPSGSLAWYVEGFLAPVIYLRRGLTYTFKVEGGNNPRSAEFYHPFIITDEPVGGYYRSSQCLRVGLSSPRCSGCRRSRGQRSECWRGSSSPGDTSPTLWTTWAGTGVVMARVVTTECDGRKCVWEHGPGGDRRRDDEFKTFSEFRNSLGLSCEEDSEPALLQVRAGVRGVGGDDGVAGDPQHHMARRGLLQQLHHPLHGLEDSHRGQLQTKAQEAGLRCGLAGQTGSCQLAGQSGHLSAGIVSNNLNYNINTLYIKWSFKQDVLVVMFLRKHPVTFQVERRLKMKKVLLR